MSGLRKCAIELGFGQGLSRFHGIGIAKKYRRYRDIGSLSSVLLLFHAGQGFVVATSNGQGTRPFLMNLAAGRGET